MDTLISQVIESTFGDEHMAVAELEKQLNIDEPAAIIFFCSSKYNLDSLSRELNSTFNCQLIGCTTAGEIAGKYKTESIVALVFSKDSFFIHSTLINDLQSFDLAKAMNIASDIERKLKYSTHLSQDKMFGFLLSDGLSLKEESLIARLNQAFDEVDIFGGSAGDDLDFKQTHIYYDGAFHTNSAVLIIIETACDFFLFKTQHFLPTEKELITTEVDFEKRIVKEINGEPAAEAFAKINNLDSNNLTVTDFAMYPLMINLTDEWFIRSISNITPDKGLQFYCAIDDGLPLCVAEGRDMLTNLEENTKLIIDKFEEIYFTLGCDCILRKVENINNKAVDSFQNIFSTLNFIGFNSYGEQFKGVHFNQTMAAVVVGKKRDRDDK